MAIDKSNTKDGSKQLEAGHFRDKTEDKQKRKSLERWHPKNTKVWDWFDLPLILFLLWLLRERERERYLFQNHIANFFIQPTQRINKNLRSFTFTKLLQFTNNTPGWYNWITFKNTWKLVTPFISLHGER